jgi:hypothetical protein
LETSAKNATNVEQAFMTMAAEIKNRMQTISSISVPAQFKRINSSGLKLEPIQNIHKGI